MQEGTIMYPVHCAAGETPLSLALLDEIDDGVLLLDRDLRVLWTNRPLRQALGIPDTGLSGADAVQVIRDRFAPLIGDPRWIGRMLDALADRREIRSLPVRIRTPGGGDGQVDCSIRLITAGPLSGATLVRFRDIARAVPRFGEVRPGQEPQPYGDLSADRTCRLILDSVGEPMLDSFVCDALSLLETSAVVYEKNGDCAYRIFSSGWCRCMDTASRTRCNLPDDRHALEPGMRHCRESCWHESARRAMELGEPADIECRGGIRIYAVPIRAGDEIIGSINVGYGNPPRDPEKLQQLADRYGVAVDELRVHAFDYQPRPPSTIELAKQRLNRSAQLIGEIVLRRRAEEAMQESEERYRSIFTTSHAVQLLIDPATGRIVDANPAASAYYGYPRERLTGMWISEVNTLEPGEVFAEMQKATVGQKRRFDFRHRLADGEIRDVEVYSGEVTVGGHRLLHSIIHDVTDRKQAEEDRARLLDEVEATHREANLYLDILTHDIRNANNVALMYAGVLLEDLSGTEQEYVRRLKAGIDKSTEILRTVATIRKINEGEDPLGPVDLAGIVREETAIFPDAHIRYEGGSMTVLAGTLLTEVFTNLIGNAAKFGGSDVEVTIRAEEKDGEVLVTVADTGPGVPDEVKDRLFHRFEPGKTPGSGQGLGLYIVRKIVERYGGKVWVEDRIPGRPEEGAAFLFTLNGWRQGIHEQPGGGLK
jgi:PAS domain S-box-containing protein